MKLTSGIVYAGQAIVRYFCYLLSALLPMADFVWIGLDRRKQGLHDKLAATVVVITDESRKSLQQLSQELNR